MSHGVRLPAWGRKRTTRLGRFRLAMPATNIMLEISAELTPTACAL
jgi:hypothetical protein